MNKTLFAICSFSLALLAACNSGSAGLQTEVEREIPLAGAPQRKPNQPFMIGMLRSDGVLVPFAKYSQGRWSTPWKKLVSYSKGDPNTLTDLPKPWFTGKGEPSTTWYFSSWGGDEKVLNTFRVVQVENHSGMNWGLVTNYSEEDSKESHHRNVGVALEAKHEVAGMIKLTDGSSEWNDVLAFIEPSFEKSEGDGLARLASVADEMYMKGYPQSDEERKKVKLTLTQLYRNKAGLNGKSVYYFAAQKEFGRSSSSGGQGCPNISFFKGWVLKNSQGQLTLLDSQHSLTNCDRKSVRDTETFVVVEVDNRLFLVTQEHGWGDESYSIWELKDSVIHHVLETIAG